MPQKTPPGRARTLLLGLGAALLALAAACGGGGGGGGARLSISGPGTVTIPVPFDYASQGFYLPPYSGTATIAITRDPGVTGAVALTVSGVPATCKAQFSAPSTSAATSVLSIQAGYPDPTDPTFTRQIYPKAGTYTLTVTAKASGVPDATTKVTLKLGDETPAIGLNFLDASGSSIDSTPCLQLGPAPLTKYLLAYYANSMGWTVSGPVSVTFNGLPAGLTATLDARAFSLDDTAPHTLVLAAQPSLAPGLYSFSITAAFNGASTTLPVVVDYSPHPFYILPAFNTAGPSVVQGGAVEFPLYLGRNDTFFTMVAGAGGETGVYTGDVLLSASGMPAGMTVTFGAGNALADPKGLQSAPLVIQADASVAPGTYPVTLQATRSTPTGTTLAAPVTLPVTVTASGAAGTTWIQQVEWGQSVVKPGLPLVAGKPALLRIQYLADRPGLAGTLTARLQDGSTLALRGPAQVPTAAVEGDLPTAAAASASTYTCLLPGSSVTSGLTVTLQGAGTPAVTVTPLVRTSLDYPLVVVPVIHKGVTPSLPGDPAITQGLLAVWPFSSVTLTHRAPYTSSTAIPEPATNPANDHSGDAWVQLLMEVASLRIVDGSSASYCGFLAPGYTFNTSPSGYTLGVTAGDLLATVGTDKSLDGSFQPLVPGQTVAVETLMHETGHVLGLNHVPAAGLASADDATNYPYLDGQVGTWGYDAYAQAAYDPATHFDLMSYSSNLQWVSDWSYLGAMGWVTGMKKVGTRLGSARAAGDRILVAGAVSPSGEVTLRPLLRAVIPAVAPVPGAYALALRSSAGTREVGFAPVQVPGLPQGHRAFLFTVDADGDPASVEVSRGGRSLARREAVLGRGMRAAALDRDAATGALEVREASGRLHLVWNASVHPYVDVVHEGEAGSTTLALHLTGGTADLPLEGLPPGGRIRVRYSDGLASIARDHDRDGRDRSR